MKKYCIYVLILVPIQSCDLVFRQLSVNVLSIIVEYKIRF